MNPSRLAKALALAASDSDGEAVAALRTVRRMLEAEGIDFVDLAHALDTHSADAKEVEDLREVIAGLRRELRQERGEKRRLRNGTASPDEAVTLRAQIATFETVRRADEARLGEALHQVRTLGDHLTAALRERHNLQAQVSNLCAEVEQLQAAPPPSPAGRGKQGKSPSTRQFWLF